ncbi:MULTISPECIES: type VI secretion system protein TssA [Methylomicrobium]|uniref:Type VI secretion-associated protein, ImpA family n=1 Tax=Methylomicrobium album BG8 TaxID=686340 RepID=H8GNN1_METAL|nr:MULTISPECIES: type VI secretion system protein TssA [Methylomicrobium]EIC30787.1 type VI secretion-associated protein, ImpA family [Methylomicrobium album BG8]
MADLDELLEEISPDSPCGDYLEYDSAYLELAKDIQGKPEDPITGEKAQPPNWRDIQKSALAILKRSKDLQVAVYLTRALIPLEGIPGFRDGLSLLLGLLEKYWVEIHPVLDPDDNLDPTMRINILEELNNFDSVLRPLSLAPLADSKAVGRYSLRDIQISTDKISLPEGETRTDLGVIKAAFQELPPESIAFMYQAIVESVDLVRRLQDFVNIQVGIGNGADLSSLASLLKEMQSAHNQYAPMAAQETAELSGEEEPAGDQASQQANLPRKQNVGVGEINSRQDVLKALDLICKYYRESEPSSPVPILLHRAKRLVTADFMEILQNLLPDAISQMDMIKGPEASE